MWRIMALTFIGQSVMSAIVGNLVNKCFSYLNAFPVPSGVQDELDRLQNALLQDQAVLTAVEEGAWPTMMQNKGLCMWLWQLRDAVEDAENVLDELEYYKLEKRIRDQDDKGPVVQHQPPSSCAEVRKSAVIQVRRVGRYRDDPVSLSR